MPVRKTTNKMSSSSAAMRIQKPARGKAAVTGGGAWPAAAPGELARGASAALEGGASPMAGGAPDDAAWPLAGAAPVGGTELDIAAWAIGVWPGAGVAAGMGVGRGVGVALGAGLGVAAAGVPPGAVREA